MKTTHPTLTATTAGWCLLAATAALFPGRAQDDDITIDRNRIWVSARFAFNLTAEFDTSNSPLLSGLSTAPGHPGTGTGYTLGLASQGEPDPMRADSVGLHAAGLPPTEFSADTDGDVQAGFEIVYGRALGFFNLSETRQAAWGVLGSFGTLDINLETEDDLSRGGATWTAYSRLDTLALGFKAGPFIELPLGKRFSANVSAGLAVVDVLNDYEYEQTLTSGGGGGPSQANEGDVQESEWLLGFFGHASVAYAFNYNVAVFAGVQYQHLGDTSLDEGGNQATLDLGQVIEAQVGLRASF